MLSKYTCPECGESVSYVNRESNLHFKHSKKTENSIECDKRTDGNNDLTYYERVGLPIYLKIQKLIPSLHIGFYPIGKKLLELAKNQNISVTISDSSGGKFHNQKHFIDFTFSENQVTLKQLGFVPDYEKNYSVMLNGIGNFKLIQNAWSDYADGFSLHGAIFTYSDNGGKKIRRNDSITTNEDYYWVSRTSKIIVLNGLESKYVSEFVVDNRKFYIYKIKINTVNESEFKVLENYFFTHLKIRLLYSQPKIIPLWPPTILINNSNHVLPYSNKIFCKIESGSDQPTVFEYVNGGYNKCPIQTIQCDMGIIVHSIKLNISNTLNPFTVDRKYIGSSILLTNFFPNVVLQDIEILLDAEMKTTLPMSSTIINLNEDKKVFSLKSNTALQVVYKMKNAGFKIGKILTKETTKFNFEKTCTEIILCKTTSLLPLFHAVLQTTKSNADYNAFEEEAMFYVLSKYRTSYLIPLPRKYKSLVQSFEKYPSCIAFAKEILSHGLVSRQVLKTLIDGGNRNG